MKFIIPFLIAGVVLSCGQNEAGKKETSVSPATDTSTNDRWHFKKYLADPNTSQLAKDIFNNNWKLNDDEPLEFLGYLHGQDKQARPFYFRVVTNTYSKADGSYAEGLGNAGYEYVRDHPDEFSNYFIGPQAFTDEDLRVWTRIVILEISIVGENQYDQPLIKDYEDVINKNCGNCSKEQKAVLEKFNGYLSKEWTEFLRHIDK